MKLFTSQHLTPLIVALKETRLHHLNFLPTTPITQQQKGEGGELWKEVRECCNAGNVCTTGRRYECGMMPLTEVLVRAAARSVATCAVAEKDLGLDERKVDDDDYDSGNDEVDRNPGVGVIV
ncbi:hypothetical protein ECG_08264 [Echinococcus granulosus]|nr:hypothetical protein ECG_08264 [Echinococcus granulosus]